MFKIIRKRDGREVPFDETKITDAIFKAARAVGGEDRQTAMELTIEVLKMLKKKYNGNVFGVEDVQDVVEKVLIEAGHARTAKAYILYRDKRTRIRDAKSDLMDAVEEILEETSRENANISNSPSAKMLQIASAASKKYYLSRLLPEEMAAAHRRGDIHIHDLDYYGKTLNCLQIPLGRLLTEGFNTGHGYIRPPRRPTSATALAAIILQSSQNDMYGGQSFAAFDRDMAPFVEQADDFETYQAMEALVYNLNSMHSRAGAQVPFSSINLGTDTSEAGRRVTRNLLLAYEAGLGRGENPIFPNIIFRVKQGVNFNPGDPNYDLFQLAVRVAARRLNPTFSFMDASFNQPYGDLVSYMGCRSRVMANRRGPEVTDGRGNLSFTTINLPRLAIRAERSLKRFYAYLDEVLRLTIEQLYHRFTVQARLKVKDMPFVMGQGLYLGSQGLKS
ncbi:MAG: anaerobic ribonucleoside-triphosphate reductase, partial [Bacillota bacterium]